MDPRAGLDTVEKKKIYFPSQEWNPGRRAHKPSTVLVRFSHTVSLQVDSAYEVVLSNFDF
jgi:hypothetical protein